MAQNYLIPTKVNKPHQRIQIDLSGSTYIIKLTWLARLGAWQFDLYAEDETPLVLCKILSNQSDVLGDNRWDERVPPGAIGLFSDIPELLPTYKNLGKEFQLYYFEF